MSVNVAAVVFALVAVAAARQSVAPIGLSQSVPTAHDAVLDTPTGSLSGTLLLPAGPSPFPVVLIVAGSGITDRDGNSAGLPGKSDSLRLLAEGLAGRGIASLRYDKRSVGKSAAARLSTNTFETQVDDAAAWVGWLGKDARFSAIGIVGHSEGALIATIAAQRGRARAAILLAGAALRFDDELVQQLSSAQRAGQLSEKALAALTGALAEIRAGRAVTTRPPAVPDQLWIGLFQPRAQEYLISIVRYDPLQEIAKLPALGVKVLVVQGTTDIQHGDRDNSPAQLAAASGTQPVMIEGMNHELKSAPLDRKGNDAASSDPRRPLAPGLIDHLVLFLNSALR